VKLADYGRQGLGIRPADSRGSRYKLGRALFLFFVLVVTSFLISAVGLLLGHPSFFGGVHFGAIYESGFPRLGGHGAGFGIAGRIEYQVNRCQDEESSQMSHGCSSLSER